MFCQIHVRSPKRANQPTMTHGLISCLKVSCYLLFILEIRLLRIVSKGDGKCLVSSEKIEFEFMLRE